MTLLVSGKTVTKLYSITRLNWMFLCSKLRNSLWKIVAKLKVVTKLRLHCIAIMRWKLDNPTLLSRCHCCCYRQQRNGKRRQNHGWNERLEGLAFGCQPSKSIDLDHNEYEFFNLNACGFIINQSINDILQTNQHPSVIYDGLTDF